MLLGAAASNPLFSSLLRGFATNLKGTDGVFSEKDQKIIGSSENNTLRIKGNHTFLAPMFGGKPDNVTEKEYEARSIEAIKKAMEFIIQ